MSFTAGQKVRASQMPGFVCTSSTRPTGHAGQYIYETDTGMVALHDGTNWQYVFATGATTQDAEFNMATAQSIANTTDTMVEFGTTNVSSPLVTKAASGTGHTFTLNRSGRWVITTTLRFAANASAGERYFAIRRTGTEVIASTGGVKAAISGPWTANLSVTKRFGVGDVISGWVYQSSGAAASMESNNGAAWGRINFSWVGP